MQRISKRLVWLVPALAASVLACESDGDGERCERGTAGCECFPNRSCATGLICSGSDLCVDDTGGSGGAGNSADGGSAGSGDSGGSGESGGKSSTGAAGANGGSGPSSGTDGGSGGMAGAGGVSGGSSGGTAGSSGGTATENTVTTGGSGATSGDIRTAITPVDGWVDASTNDVGIQGGWYTFADDISTVIPATEPFFEGAGSAICISGTALPHENQDLSWGVAVGMDLNAFDDRVFAYDALLYGVTGIQFTVTGSLPPRLQINTTSLEGLTYCRRYESITGSQETLSVYFDQMERDCWELDAANPAPDASALATFTIQVISSANEPVPFDFCVEDVAALLE